MDGLAKAFGKSVVLRSASFAARPATVTALMGRNGAGKSTMLRIAVGRVRADRGRVIFRGETLSRPALAGMAREGLFYASQDCALTDLFSIGQHLNAVAEVFGRSGEIAETVDRFALGECLARRPRALSGGERKRAALALAALREPSCLLMDEPFVGVEPKERLLVADALRSLRDGGCAVIITGHDVEDLFAVADVVVWVAAGVTHDLGPPRAAREDARFRREYLGASVS